MKTLVTGATGFVGANLVRELIGDGIEVRALVRTGGDVRNLAGLDIELLPGDVRDFESVRRAMKGCDRVFHVAAYYSVREADSQMLYEVNLNGTRNVMRAAGIIGVSKVVHTSTIGTIGRPDGPTPADESCEFNLWETASPYVRSKYLGEREALGAAASSGLPVVVVHPCAPVGPFDVRPSATGQRVLDFLVGNDSSFPSGGINFVDVADVARGHILAALKGRVGERYILGYKNLMLSEFLAVMEKASGQRSQRPGSRARARSLVYRILWKRRSSAPAPPQALTCDCSKALAELGLPQTPLEIAFARSVKWYRENGYVDRARLSMGA